MAGPKGKGKTSKEPRKARKADDEVSSEDERESANEDAGESPAKPAVLSGDGDVRLPAAVAARLTKKADAAPREERFVRLRVRRQDAFDRPETRRWDEFRVPFTPKMTVHGALEEIRKDPRTSSGDRVAPPVWESACLEEVCGSCTMLVNGRVRQACSTFVDDLAPKGERITLEPLSKFPIERDLIVDKSRMFESLKQVKAWIELDGAHELGPGPRESQATQAERYPLSRCMSCGACLEACPEYGESRPFVGATVINQVRLINMHPLGAMQKTERLEALMGEGGITDCGKAQNCVEVCPQEIPLVDSIGAVSRDTTKQLIFGWILK
jgi:succinate dehydrogenase iron-sulfur subunit